MLITILMFIYAKQINENFSTSYLNELDINDEKMKLFCKELSLLDKPSENTLLIIESTVPPGTCERIIYPDLKKITKPGKDRIDIKATGVICIKW